MNSLTSYKSSKLYGEVIVPGDKSISHRALIIGSLVTGKIKIKNLILLTKLSLLFLDDKPKSDLKNE